MVLLSMRMTVGVGSAAQFCNQGRHHTWLPAISVRDGIQVAVPPLEVVAQLMQRPEGTTPAPACAPPSRRLGHGVAGGAREFPSSCRHGPVRVRNHMRSHQRPGRVPECKRRGRVPGHGEFAIPTLLNCETGAGRPRNVVCVQRRALLGSIDPLHAARHTCGWSGKVQTAFVERLRLRRDSAPGYRPL
jgi:hypothetical protein